MAYACDMIWTDKQCVVYAVERYNDDAMWIFGEDILDKKDMIANAERVAEEYDLATESGRYTGSLYEYLASFVLEVVP